MNAEASSAGGRAGRLRLYLEVLLLAALVAALAWIGRVLDDPRHFPVRVVHVDGEFQHLDATELKRRINGHLHGSFFGVDLAEIYAAVGDLAWVDRVTLRREWPDTLWVGIVEQQPVAHWRGQALINARAEVFRPQRPVAGLDGLPQLSGPAGRAAEIWALYRRIDQRLAPLGLEVAGLRRDARRALSLDLAGGPRLRLGRESVDDRLERFIGAYPEVLAPRVARIETIDLRYPNGFAVAWSDGQQTRGGDDA